MLNLFDHLTNDDNKILYNYITTYASTSSEYCGNEVFLRHWARENKKLFHLLGGTLIYKEPFVYERVKEEIESDMQNMFRENGYNEKLEDMKATINQLYNDGILSYSASYDLRVLIETYGRNPQWTVFSRIKVKAANNERTLQFQEGMPLTRALQKMIQYFPELSEYKAIFEEIRIKVSQVLNDKKIKGNICISIHPMDFITMSDNGLGWTSCMNWTNQGYYLTGSMEMLNSNNVVCAYLESAKPWIFNPILKEDNTWNNKKLRQLFYVTKDIIVGGKTYPFQNLNFTRRVLDILKRLSEQNLNRTYTYGIEEYNDMKHIGSLDRMCNNREWIRTGDTFKHNIIFDTNSMYNDMLNDHDGDTKYLCYRNKVKKTKIIKYSGKTCCLKCGDEIVALNEEWGETEYNERYCNTSSFYCSDCQDGRAECETCGKSNVRIVNIDGINVCKYCAISKMKKCPCCGEPFLAIIYNPKLAPVILVNDGKMEDLDSSSVGDRAAESLVICKNCFNKLLKEKFIKKADIPKDVNRPYSMYWKNTYITTEILKYFDYENWRFYALQKVDPNENIWYDINNEKILKT